MRQRAAKKQNRINPVTFKDVVKDDGDIRGQITLIDLAPKSKISSFYALLMLPTLVLTEINIQLIAKFDGTQCNLIVFPMGGEIAIITDTDRATFNLNDENLKYGVEEYVGRRPDDVYLRNPTPWGDLYKNYHWPEVMTSIVAKSGKAFGVRSQPMILTQHIFENNSSAPATFNVAINQVVQNTITSSWYKEGNLSITADVRYNFGISIAGGDGSTSFSYKSAWGESVTKTESYDIGSSSGVQVLLQPGQAVIAELFAETGTIKLEIEYEARLSGTVIANYGDPFRDHHFWGMDIQYVQEKGRLKKTSTSTETIDIGFYSQSKIVVTDEATGLKLLEFAL